MKRRDLLRAGVTGVVSMGIAKALHNTVVGYGHVGIGENLLTQDLDDIARGHFRTPRAFSLEIEGEVVRLLNGAVRITDANGRSVNVSDADVPHAAATFATDIDELRAGQFSFRFLDADAFFDYLPRDELRAPAVEFIRGTRYSSADPDTVEEFVGTDPRQSATVARGLIDAFREHTRYDVPRYLAGSVDDNLLPVDANLRAPFRPDWSIDTLLTHDGPVGLFCGEYTLLANRVMRAVPARAQSLPLYALIVRDRRHKHVYNGFGTVRRTEEGLELPITFVDYMDTTLYGDFRLTRLLGSGFNAYDEWHRADSIHW